MSKTIILTYKQIPMFITLSLLPLLLRFSSPTTRMLAPPTLPSPPPPTPTHVPPTPPSRPHAKEAVVWISAVIIGFRLILLGASLQDPWARCDPPLREKLPESRSLLEHNKGLPFWRNWKERKMDRETIENVFIV